MTNLLKKAAIIAIATTICVTAFSQEKDDVAIGANVVIGMGHNYTNVGIGPKVQYNLFKYIRAEGSYTYFLKKNDFSMWDLNLNGHLLVPLGGKITIYPLAGIGILGFTNSLHNREISLNLGGGIDFPLNDKAFFNVELKHKLSNDWDRTALSAGIVFKL